MCHRPSWPGSTGKRDFFLTFFYSQRGFSGKNNGWIKKISTRPIKGSNQLFVLHKTRIVQLKRHKLHQTEETKQLQCHTANELLAVSWCYIIKHTYTSLTRGHHPTPPDWRQRVKRRVFFQRFSIIFLHFFPHFVNSSLCRSIKTLLLVSPSDRLEAP